jgi:hypothetical protein
MTDHQLERRNLLHVLRADGNEEPRHRAERPCKKVGPARTEDQCATAREGPDNRQDRGRRSIDIERQNIEGAIAG